MAPTPGPSPEMATAKLCEITRMLKTRPSKYRTSAAARWMSNTLPDLRSADARASLTGPVTNARANTQIRAHPRQPRSP
eukprot:9468349-Lingulodinium_polyedra.AAC.1